MVDAAHEIMEDAYLKASGGGTLPVKPRQIMYAARGHIQGRTGKKLDDRYFCQTILPTTAPPIRSRPPAGTSSGTRAATWSSRTPGGPSRSAL